MKIHNGRVGFVEPMLAVAVTKLPEGPAWSYELKFDGYRAIGVKAAGQVRLFSRNGKDFTRRFASVSRALEALPDDTVVDGEIIAYDTDGRPSFNVLQNRRRLVGTAPTLMHRGDRSSRIRESRDPPEDYDRPFIVGGRRQAYGRESAEHSGHRIGSDSNLAAIELLTSVGGASAWHNPKLPGHDRSTACG